MRYFSSAALVMLLLTVSFFSTIPTSENASGLDESSNEDYLPLNNGTMRGLYDGILTYEDTVLIVNDDSAISKEIADYFVERRDIPQINIVNITAPTDEIIDFDEFDDMFDQIKTTLANRDLTDKIEYMVTTKGVPLKITSGYTNMNDQRYYSSASVDSELMLMDSSYESDIHRRWWIDNPYFQENVDPEDMEPFSRDKYGIRLVTRLTGYTVDEAKRLVDLAEPSLGVRGEAYMDVDPRKDSQSGYKVGNDWMRGADTWFTDNGHVSDLDQTNTFRTEHTNVSAYFSWGSNDGSWGSSQMVNTGFESGSGPSVSSWTVEDTGGIVERTTESVGSGSWSLKMERTGDGALRAYQNVSINYADHRYIADGRMRLSAVSSLGARILIEGYDSQNSLLFTHTLANRTGSRNWDYYQDPIENYTTAVKLRYIVELLGYGTAYFDQTNMRVIRPHNEWVYGAIAETIVSTGGRSQTYGTWYGQSLVADLIRDGVTGIKGYAWEPFIGAVSHADILFPAYYSGFSLAESYWMGSEIGSWMGYVIGDPKCTPYLNERADMGFAQDMEPLEPFVDEEGIPHLSIRLYNKGKTDVVDGLVELKMQNVTIWDSRVDIDALGYLYVNISSDDEAQIIGENEFEVVLNSDGAIWEYDGKNNQLIERERINTIPVMEADLSVNDLTRTEPIDIKLTITDPDMDINSENIEIEVRDPVNRIYHPDPVDTTRDDTSGEFVYQFIPPWNASLGFYSVWIKYTDPQGSFSEVLKYSSFKVLNHAPELNGNISIEEVERGGRFALNLTWEDPDTPDGSLEIDAFITRPIGGRIDPLVINFTSDHSMTCEFEIPVVDPSGTWTVEAEVTDRDDKSDSWITTIRSFNKAPNMLLLEGHSDNITRLETAFFSVKYLDPEGLSANNIDLKVIGPIESTSPETVLFREFSLQDGQTRDFEVAGNSLAIGQYQLIIEYRDDEGAGDTLTQIPLFTVIPMAPVISEPVITYDTGEGPPGGIFIKGDSIPMSFPINDPDGLGDPLTITSKLILPDGSEKDLFMERRGDGDYRSKVNTDGTWEVGTYSLILQVEDGDGMNASIQIPALFILDAELPIFDDGSVFVDLNQTAFIDISITSFLTTSKPATVTIFLYDGADNLVGEGQISEEGGFGSYEGEIAVSGKPVRGSILVIDDLDREIWMNETLDFDYQEEISSGPGDSGKEDEESKLILYIILVGVALLLILLAIIAAVMITRSKNSDMMAAPPPGLALPGPAGQPQLPVTTAPALPASQAGTELSGTQQETLPPGKNLEDVGSYHPPAEEAKAPPKNIETPEPAPQSPPSQPAPEEPQMSPAPAPVPINEDIPSAPEPVMVDAEKGTVPPSND